MNDDVMVGILKAPEDPEDHKKWAKAMANLQISMWISDGAKCEHCGHIYENIDDFKSRNPKFAGFDKDRKILMVDKACWTEYLSSCTSVCDEDE